jgi:citrate/tricarballylate utilization protein
MMAGNVLGKGYTAGVGMAIGTAFGRIAGTQAARRQGHGQRASQASRKRNMQHLEALTREAAALARGALPLTADEGEVARTLQICNACRYCEGFCAVFPAMTRRLEFPRPISTTWPICATTAAPAITPASTRRRTSSRSTFRRPWPRCACRPMATTPGRPRSAAVSARGLTMALALAGGLALFLLMVLAMRGTLLHAPLAGNFYAIFPHNLLAAMFGVVFVFAMVALGIGVTRFWRQVTPGTRASDDGGAAGRRRARCAALKYLAAATAKAATTRTTRSRCCAAASTISRSTASCCALPRPRWPRCITTCWICTRRIRDEPAGAAGHGGRHRPADRPAGLLWLNLRRDPRTGDPARSRWTVDSSRCCS